MNINKQTKSQHRYIIDLVWNRNLVEAQTFLFKEALGAPNTIIQIPGDLKK